MSGAVPRVAVFSTGGTIASKRSVDGAASPNLTADDLIAAVPPLPATKPHDTGLPTALIAFIENNSTPSRRRIGIFKMMSAVGPSRQFAATQHFGRFQSEADID